MNGKEVGVTNKTACECRECIRRCKANGEIRRKDAGPNTSTNIQYESINSRSLADIVSTHKKKLILWLRKNVLI
ncbi:hypothetical protein ALC62_03385 [Cyphomyrmex costatus]|uniref:Uncharacterized protein n=1 Tax=Cyphomyrmex costatus TaxID=456900 RepID=A0A195CYI2_9HYME|nr:hypothetical protein ALC62_03385 [Cyphomyrmex costatus]